MLQWPSCGLFYDDTYLSVLFEFTCKFEKLVPQYTVLKIESTLVVWPRTKKAMCEIKMGSQVLPVIEIITIQGARHFSCNLVIVLWIITILF